jgi:predicted HicB family RNase H-like nuclease
MYFPKVSLDPPADGDDIQVTITVQHSSIEVGEGEPINDSDTTEIQAPNIETIHNDESEESKEDEALEEQEIPELEGTRTRSGRNVKMPDRLIAEMNAAANNYEI